MRVPLCFTYVRPVTVGVKTTTKCCSSIPLHYHGVFKHWCCNTVIEQENQQGWRGGTPFQRRSIFFLPSFNLICVSISSHSCEPSHLHIVPLPHTLVQPLPASVSFTFFVLSSALCFSFFSEQSFIILLIDLNVFQYCLLLNSFVFEFVSVMVYRRDKKRRILQFYFQACWSPAIQDFRGREFVSHFSWNSEVSDVLLGHNHEMA